MFQFVFLIWRQIDQAQCLLPVHNNVLCVFNGDDYHGKPKLTYRALTIVSVDEEPSNGLKVGMADAKLTFLQGVEISKRRCFQTLLRRVTKAIRSIGACHKCFETWHTCRFCVWLTGSETNHTIAHLSQHNSHKV